MNEVKKQQEIVEKTFQSLLVQLKEMPTFDAYVLFSLLSGHDKEELMIGPQAMLNHLLEVTLGDYLEVILNRLQTNFFLPPIFSNTTMGAISVKETIDEGRSRILHSLLHLPSIREILVDSVHSTVVNDESVSNIEVKDNDGNALLTYSESYNVVKSSNASLVLHHLLQSGFVRMYSMTPRFCLNGWSELLPSFYLSASPLAIMAFTSITEDVKPLLTTQRSILMEPRQHFLHNYYLNQLQSEYLILMQIVDEYENCFTDTYPVEEWLQGLIELENLSSTFLLHAQMLVRETVNQQGE